MSYFQKIKLLETSKDIIKNSYNLNYKENIFNVDVEYIYYPDQYKGSNPPKVRFVLHTDKGKVIHYKDCPKQYIDFVQAIIKAAYEVDCKLPS